MRERRPWFDLHDESASRPRVSIVGLPYDGTASLKDGAALAPARLRALSATTDPITRRGARLGAMTVRDFGDVAPRDAAGTPRTQQSFFEAVLARMASLPKDTFVLALGGDNSVTIPCLRSFIRRHGSGVGVVWFDAHPDLFESYDGNPDSHACALRRAMTVDRLSESHVVLLGTRSFSDEEARFIGPHGERRIEVITAADWWSLSADALVDKVAARLDGLSAVYLAVDIDGFDASCAPGTGYPMPGGPLSEMFFAVHERLFARLPIRAMDITEIAPPLDTNDVTSFLGVQIVLETLGALR